MSIRSTTLERARTLIPVIEWAPNYKLDYLRPDAIAGLTVAAIVIPEGMAYALLMKLPIVIGLYSALIPLIVYSVFGPNRQLSVGPASLVSLVIAATVGQLAGADENLYLAFVFTTTILAGVIMLIGGVARLGYVENFISDPVVTGFSAGAAFVIIIGQLGPLFGYSVDQSPFPFEVIGNTIADLDMFDAVAFVIGMGGIVIMLVARHFSRRIPSALIVIVIATAIVAALDLQEDIPVVGPVSSSFPTPQVHQLTAEQVWRLLPAAFSVTLIAFVQSYAVAQFYARRNRERVNSNRELAALGITNIVSGVFSAYAACGSFARTAAAAEIGQRTQFASVLAAGLVAAVIAFATPLLEPMPKSILAAVVMVSVVGLIDVAEARRLSRVKQSDLGLLLVAFFATLILGVTFGILVAVVVSMLDVIRHTVNAEIVLLARMPGMRVWRSVDRNPDAEIIPGLPIVRIDAPLYYANTDTFMDRISEIESGLDAPMWALIIDGRSVNELDSTGVDALCDLATDYESRDVVLAFSTLHGPVIEVMHDAGLVSIIGEDHLYTNNATAVADLITRCRPSWLEDPEQYLSDS